MTRLSSTQLSRVSFSRDPVFFWPHDVSTNTNIIYLITDVMYDVYKNVHKNGVVGRRDSSGLPWIWISMDISMCGYQTYDMPWMHLRMCDISVSLVIPAFNLMTICACIGDADTLLLLRIFYAFLFFLCSYYSFSPNLRSLLLPGNERDNWNFNAMRRMVSIRDRLLYSIINLI